MLGRVEMKYGVRGELVSEGILAFYEVFFPFGCWYDGFLDHAIDRNSFYPGFTCFYSLFSNWNFC